MDATELYDEFGNYIGGDLEEEEEESEEEDYANNRTTESNINIKAQGNLVEFGDNQSSSHFVETDVGGEADRAIVPHEEKKYYADASEVYENVEVLVEEEDTQPITEPIIAPIKTKNFDLIEKELPTTNFSYDFLCGLMYQPKLIRNICILGSLHHGKTTFVDMLIQQTHTFSHTNKNKKKKLQIKKGVESAGWNVRYTDSRVDEQERGLSIKCSPISLILQNSNDKSYLLNILDTPGHVCFVDECAASMRICDGCVIMVDALEGVMANTEKLIKHALHENLDITLVVNCIDRLILELRLPPADAYHKLRHTIEEVNAIVEKTCGILNRKYRILSPVEGNVIFASGQFAFCFSVFSFANFYYRSYGLNYKSSEMFAKCLWGDRYFDRKSKKFNTSPPSSSSDAPRSFVEFVLTPIYKLFARIAGEEQEDLQPILHDLGVYLKTEEYCLETRLLIKCIFKKLFGDATAFVDMIVNNISNPMEASPRKVSDVYTGNQSSKICENMKQLNTNCDLMVYTTKNFHRPDCATFDVFGRVMSGVIKRKQKVKVLGEAFSLDDDEDMVVREIKNLWIYQSRYRIEVNEIPAGNWVLIGGVDSSISKTSTVSNIENCDEIEIFRPLKFHTSCVIKTACEPLNPSELPKMLEGLRRMYKSYPLSKTKVEESGEHIVLGTGEIYMDCLLHDLRKLYGDLEIKVADPVVQFCETVVETSAVKCFAETPNKKNKLYCVAEPLEKGISEDIEKELVNIKWDQRELGDYFTSKYNWDVLSARSIWAFGPDVQGPNILIDDTLPSEVNKNLLLNIKDFVVQGFQWATREGPLIEENIRSVKFKLLDASIANDAISRGGGQIIPTARRVAYSAFLLASPRLMEPIMFTEIQCPADCVAAIYTVLSRRRGHVSRDMPKAGTPLYIVHGFLPAIECFGFETDLRTHTSGQAFCMSMFDHWSLVPGDPLDNSIILRPLEPAPAPHLAREFLLKTRRRKGLSEDVSIHKFFDDPMLVNIAADLNQYF